MSSQFHPKIVRDNFLPGFKNVTAIITEPDNVRIVSMGKVIFEFLCGTFYQNTELLNAKSKSLSRTDEICPRDLHVKFKNNTSGRERLWDTALKFLCPGLVITSPDQELKAFGGTQFHC